MWVGRAVALGRVVRFDDVRGYGFIAPEEGGEDIFVHANDLLDEKHQYKPGVTVEFRVGQGDRGLKASLVKVVDSGSAREPGLPTGLHLDGEDDGMCDVLSPLEFRRELTEALIEASPTLTAAQIVEIRNAIARVARGHGWLTS